MQPRSARKLLSLTAALVATYSEFHVSADPPKDGNCQFSSIALELSRIGVGEWLASSLRQEIISFMETHRSSAAMDIDFRQFINCGWKHYLLKMRKPGEFGDHITLQACAKRFAINILVVSSAGRTHNQLIPGTTTSPVSADYATPTITIGHYTDQVMKGGHYVVLSPRTPTTVRDVIGSMVRDTSRPIQNEEMLILISQSLETVQPAHLVTCIRVRNRCSSICLLKRQWGKHRQLKCLPLK